MDTEVKPHGEARPRGSPLRAWLERLARRPEAGIALVLLILMAVLGLATRSFLTADNLFGIVRNYSDIAISALGMTMVIITGGIDLSVGSIMALAGLVAALAVTSWGLPVPLAILVGVLTGGLVGLANGLLIVRLRLVPFIATLGMLGVVRGIVVGTTSGQTVRGFPSAFTWLGQGYLGPVPMPVIVLLIFAVAVGLFLRYHYWGTYIYAIGGNETSARLTGLPVDRVKLFVYLMSGLLSGVAGVLVVSRLGVSAPTQAQGYELNVVAAAVIGGVSLQGGRGTIPGAVLGAIIIGVLYNALVMLRIDTYWQQAFIGGIIILAAIVDVVRQRRG
ncbi:ABC transporter permease [Kallotenue papyrolyticum]|uniref:ABC transporter permease n=1 Tax=Kallotenue papyrolyticum TaxID=1325125 RepID=UPI00047862B1|nr:ABC transporter permease [Kallotenue papyrolyticum]